MGIRKPGNTQGPAHGPVSPGASRAQEANPPAKAETAQELDPIDALQLVLDLAGMVPGMGMVPDLINSAVSLMRGDFVGALASAASAVPGVGDVAGAAKIAKNAEKYLEAIKAVEQKVLHRLPAAIRTQLQEQLGKLRAKVDELLKKEKAQAKPKEKGKEKPKEKAESKSSDGKGKDGGRSEGSDRGRCTLQPKRKKCPDGKTGHHVVPDHCFVIPRKQGGGRYPGTEGITCESGLVICVGGANKSSGKRGGSIKRSSYKGNGRLSPWFADLVHQLPSSGRLLRRWSAQVDVWQHARGLAFTGSPMLTPTPPSLPRVAALNSAPTGWNRTVRGQCDSSVLRLRPCRVLEQRLQGGP